MKIATTSIIAFSILMSLNAHAGLKGTPKQQACVQLQTAPDKDIFVETYQEINDTGNGGVEVTLNEDFTIPAGSSAGEYCGDSTIKGNINRSGQVGISFTIKQSGNIMDTFSSYSTFDGDGASNNWDLSEKGRCSTSDENGNGVMMRATDKHGQLLTGCNQFNNIPDENTAKIIFTPQIQIDGNPDHGYPHYDAASVEAGSQVWIKNDIAFSEETESLYRCEQTNWCNGDPDYYAPGAGSNWDQAWSIYGE
ncbi:hypothetical protein HQQ94_16600 [Shewanella sp. VB17]|uniref:hypothetical protein n=1 Tax=Shewanella sp. VB17 TaxID=2739432 RepID=UPI001567522D|nr:hypothetical protein [Shewanella sp. VB17]NRD74808.1 hypothetical protein [Shewanella sp. VB17]